MKDFGRWFAGQGSVGLGPEEPAEPVTSHELADAGFEVDDDHEGRILAVYAECRMCQRRIKLSDYLTHEEILASGDATNQYCGSGPRCCP